MNGDVLVGDVGRHCSRFGSAGLDQPTAVWPSFVLDDGSVVGYDDDVDAATVHPAYDEASVVSKEVMAKLWGAAWAQAPPSDTRSVLVIEQV